MEKLKAASNDRRKLEIQRELDNVDAKIYALRSEMDAELGALRERKGRANNNLAGATLEQSISTEMQMVEAKYDARIKVVMDTAAILRAELAAIGN